MNSEEYIEYSKTKIVADIWNCGDCICDCNQPIIERITPDNYPWIKRERLWEGTFGTDGENYKLMEEELKEAIDKFRSNGYAVILEHGFIFN